MRKKWIWLPRGEGAKLAVLFETTPVTVCSALGFKTNSPLAKMLRKAALERGGKIMEVN